MKKVRAKSIRTGQTIYSIGWHGYDPAKDSGLTGFSEYYTYKHVVGSYKNPLPDEGSMIENPVNLSYIKKWLTHEENRPEARVKFWYSRRRAEREVTRSKENEQ